MRNGSQRQLMRMTAGAVAAARLHCPAVTAQALGQHSLAPHFTQHALQLALQPLPMRPSTHRRDLPGQLLQHAAHSPCGRHQLRIQLACSANEWRLGVDLQFKASVHCGWATSSASSVPVVTTGGPHSRLRCGRCALACRPNHRCKCCMHMQCTLHPSSMRL